jgi:hypothetical protein
MRGELGPDAERWPKVVGMIGLLLLVASLGVMVRWVEWLWIGVLMGVCGSVMFLICTRWMLTREPVVYVMAMFVLPWVGLFARLDIAALGIYGWVTRSSKIKEALAFGELDTGLLWLWVLLGWLVLGGFPATRRNGAEFMRAAAWVMVPLGIGFIGVGVWYWQMREFPVFDWIPGYFLWVGGYLAGVGIVAALLSWRIGPAYWGQARERIRGAIKNETG